MNYKFIDTHCHLYGEYYDNLDSFFIYQNIFGTNAMNSLAISMRESSSAKNLKAYVNHDLFTNNAYDNDEERNDNAYKNIEDVNNFLLHFLKSEIKVQISQISYIGLNNL